MSNTVSLGFVKDLLPDVKTGKIDLDKLGTSLADILVDAATGLIEGGQQDLALYASKIADDTIRVMQNPDVEKREKQLAELMGQIQIIGEINRMRATQEAWATFTKVAATVIKTVVKFVAPI